MTSLIARDRKVRLLGRKAATNKNGTDCCCDNDNPPPVGDCCGCAKCNPVYTISIHEEWILRDVCEGPCDLSIGVVQTTVVQMIRQVGIACDPDNNPACEGSCQWTLLAPGSRVQTQTWLFPDSSCGNDVEIPPSVIPVSCGSSQCVFAIECPTCGNAALPPYQNRWAISIRPFFANQYLFVVATQEGPIDACPTEIGWEPPIFPTGPSGGGCFEVQDYTVEWSIA